MGKGCGLDGKYLESGEITVDDNPKSLPVGSNNSWVGGSGDRENVGPVGESRSPKNSLEIVFKSNSLSSINIWSVSLHKHISNMNIVAMTIPF